MDGVEEELVLTDSSKVLGVLATITVLLAPIVALLRFIRSAPGEKTRHLPGVLVTLGVLMIALEGQLLPTWAGHAGFTLILVGFIALTVGTLLRNRNRKGI